MITLHPTLICTLAHDLVLVCHPAILFLLFRMVSLCRWAMFGFAVGMLTEYATGSDFVDQVKILLSNFGILDLE